MGKNNLYVNRSISACLKDATTMFLNNLSNILKKMWVPQLFISIFFTCIILSFTPNKQLYDWSTTHGLLSFLILIASYIAFFFCMLWSMAKSYMFMNGTSFKGSLKRCTTPFILFLVLSYLIFSCVFGNTHKWIISGIVTLHISAKMTDILTCAISCLTVIIIASVIIPFQYALTHYILDTNVKLYNVFKKEYVIGLHYWGFLFLSALMTTLIIAILSSVIVMPIVIILFANISNTYGIINGDTDGVPNYFYMLLIITSMVCTFIISHLLLWQLYVNCYICGTINIRYKEKCNQEKIVNQYETTKNTIH